MKKHFENQLRGQLWYQLRGQLVGQLRKELDNEKAD
jgi:hypothetical protein